MKDDETWAKLSQDFDLHAYESISAAKQGLTGYLAFFNRRRPHSSLDRQTPDEFYYENLPKQQSGSRQ